MYGIKFYHCHQRPGLLQYILSCLWFLPLYSLIYGTEGILCSLVQQAPMALHCLYKQAPVFMGLLQASYKPLTLFPNQKPPCQPVCFLHWSLSLKKKWNSDVWYNIDEPWRYNAEVKKASHQRADVIWFHSNEVHRVVRFIETENRMVVARCWEKKGLKGR